MLTDSQMRLFALRGTRPSRRQVFLPSGCLLLGHRGFARSAPENTISACLDAIQWGADGVEIDLRCTLEGEAVVFHDDTLSRLVGIPGAINTMPLSQIQACLLKGAEGFHSDTIPTFQELLEALPSGIFVNVEIKDAPPLHLHFEDKVVAQIVAFRHKFHFIISSFNPKALHRFRMRSETIPLGLLMAPDLVWPLRTGALLPLLRPEAIHPHYSMVTSSLVDMAHEKDMKVYPWTVNDVAEASRLGGLGVDGLITDQVQKITDMMGHS
tara:strand:+ start:1198 stop:2001 length:804 start_codon:yes stop_codon:yes gene_type:complete